MLKNTVQHLGILWREWISKIGNGITVYLYFVPTFRLILKM